MRQYERYSSRVHQKEYTEELVAGDKIRGQVCIRRFAGGNELTDLFSHYLASITPSPPPYELVNVKGIWNIRSAKSILIV